MEYISDPEIAAKLVEKVPPSTVNDSPHLQHILKYFNFQPTTLQEQYTHSWKFIPSSFIKYQRLDGTALRNLYCQTPVDQIIVCTLAHHLPGTPVEAIEFATPVDLEQRAAFCIRNVHCLDTLDVLMNVLHVLNSKAIAFEQDVWDDREAAQAAIDAPSAWTMTEGKWYDAPGYFPSVFGGWAMDDMLEGSANVQKRVGRFFEVMGEQYSKVVQERFDQAPNHMSYTIRRNVTA